MGRTAWTGGWGELLVSEIRVPGSRGGGGGRQKIKEGSKMQEAGGVMLVYSVEDKLGKGGAECGKCL